MDTRFLIFQGEDTVPNDYYERQASLPEFTTARADDIRQELDGVQSAFEKLPTPRLDGTKGFTTPFTIVNPSADNHPATHKQVSNENTKNGQQDIRLDAIETILAGLGNAEERYTTLRYVATEGQTEIVLPLQFQSLAYVYKNGVRLFQTVDFDYESSTKTLTFYQALTAGDIILVDVGLVPDSVLTDLIAIQDDVTSKHSDVETWHSDVDGWQQQVSEDKDTTLAASIAAQADANYEGDFVSGVTNAEKGKSYSFDNEIWRCLSNTSDDPSINNASWKKAVSVDDVNKAEERALGVGVKIYRGKNGQYVENGNVVPTKIPPYTHLTIPINGEAKTVAMSPIANGAVSDLTETGATIGGTPVDFQPPTTKGDFSRNRPVDFTLGIDITSYTQRIWHNGVVYNPSIIGYTTSSTFEKDKFVVDQTFITKADRPLTPCIFDMHYGALKGQGQVDGAAIGEFDYTLSLQALAGQRGVTLSDISGLLPNMLVAYLCEDGEYYTNVIESINSLTVTMKEDLQENIAVGQNLWNGWNDEAHVTVHGYYAVADYLLRNAINAYFEVDRSNKWTSLGSATINEITGVNNAEYPGGFVTPTYEIVTDGAPNQGARIEFEPVAVGSYRIPIHVNTSNEDVTIAVVSVNSGFTLWSQTLNKNTCSTINAEFKVFEESSIRVNVLCLTPNSTYINELRLLRTESDSVNLHGKRLALFGDSWFFAGHIEDRLNERLPSTTIINLGVSGNNAQNLLDRFDTDVVPMQPDVVWVNTSTNDYFQSSDGQIFFWRLTQVEKRINDIGASCIVSTPTVGNADTAPQRFDRSRYFYNDNYYYDQKTAKLFANIHVNVQNIVTTLSGQQYTFAYLGYYDGEIKIKESYLSHSIKIFSGPNVGSQSEIGDIASGYVPTNLSFTANGFVTLKAVNTSGLSETLQGYLVVSTENSKSYS